jgi:hypothetical protein
VVEAGCHIGDAVGIELGFLHLAAGQVVLVPRTVGVLEALQPGETGLGLGLAPVEHQRHQRLDVVPGVGMATGVPGHHAVAQLPLGHRSTVSVSRGHGNALDAAAINSIRSSAVLLIRAVGHRQRVPRAAALRVTVRPEGRLGPA